MLRDDDGSDAMPTIAIDCHGRNACRELLPFEAAIGTQAAPRVQARGHGSARFFSRKIGLKCLMDKRKQLSKQEFTKPDRAPCAVTELLLHRPCTAQGHRRGSSPTAPGATIIHALLLLLQLHAMAAIHITDIEAAINHWRERAPASGGAVLAPEISALGEVYALMVYRHQDETDEHSLPAPARAAWLAWYDTTPDTPCIAICSTSQGDDWCKGCGRSFDEVQFWPAMGPAEKRAVWRRITQEHTAWRFNRYAERAAEGRTGAAPGAIGAAATSS